MAGDSAIPLGAIFLVLGAALALPLLAALARLFMRRPEAGYRQKAFLSPAERSFLGVLSQAAGDDWQVFAKVRIADVLTPDRGISRSRWQSAFNAISAKHFDFLLCNPADQVPKLAIELDDKSHEKARTRKRDRLVDQACKSAGLPLLRVRAAKTYPIPGIREQIREATSPKPDQEHYLADTAVHGGRRDPTFGPTRPKSASNK